MALYTEMSGISEEIEYLLDKCNQCIFDDKDKSYKRAEHYTGIVLRDNIEKYDFIITFSSVERCYKISSIVKI